MDYALLYHPGHNRVYFEASLKLAVSELAIVARKLSVGVENARHEKICGVDYLTFQTGGGLTDADARLVCGLSFFYALFEIARSDGGVSLKPIQSEREGFVDESIGAILKYTGKTNEIFTRMMINIAYGALGNTEDARGMRLLDPVAGKGTTLYEGLIKGYNVYGIEIGAGVVNESYHFVKRFLETARYKFEYASMKVSGPNRSFSAQRYTFVTARTKEGFKSGNTRTIEFVAGNSLRANKYYKKNYFDMIVGDLPYGEDASY